MLDDLNNREETEDIQADFDMDVPELEAKLLKQIMDEYGEAQKFMAPFHRTVVDRREMYFNALRFDRYKQKKQVPTTFFQQQIDGFVAWMMEKLWYKNRPCTIVGVEDSDAGDADAKQELMDWQDYKDKMHSKCKKAVKDAALSRIAVSQVDYAHETERRPVGVLRPKPAIDPETGEYIIDPLSGEILPQIDESGQPIMFSEVEIQEVPVYLGPRVKRVDPVKFFVKQDKSRENDESMMIRDELTFKEIRKGSFYINKDKLGSLASFEPHGQEGTGAHVNDSMFDKQRIKYPSAEKSRGKNYHDYLEWQGKVNQLKLYEYLGKETEINGEPVAGPDDEVWVIAGVLETRLMIRLEESPFGFDGPNIVVGLIEEDEDELIGTSISDKIVAVAKMKDIMSGVRTENLKQAVNSGWIINKNAIVNEVGRDGPTVNVAGFVLMTNDNVNNVAKRVDQQIVSPDIDKYDDRLTQEGQTGSGLGEIISGEADPNVSTLGETQIVQAHSTIRLTSYLKTFEETWVQPIYEMRNLINVQFLDQKYVFGIIGQGAIEWRSIDPETIRASVDFLCESSSRETRRDIKTQQILQLTKITANVMISGIPVPQRTDKLLAQLAEEGFSWSREQVEQWLPLLKFERVQEIDIDQAIVQSFLGQLALQGVAIEQTAELAKAGGLVAGGPEGGNGAGQPGGGGGPDPRPRNDQELEASMQRRNNTQVART